MMYDDANNIVSQKEVRKLNNILKISKSLLLSFFMEIENAFKTALNPPG
jgi:hypothetical protein